MAERLRRRIVVVGSVNMNLMLRCPHLPRPGETVLGSGLQTAPAQPLRQAMLRGVDLLVTNQLEAAAPAGLPAGCGALDAAPALRQAGPGQVLITLGSQGVRGPRPRATAGTRRSR